MVELRVGQVWRQKRHGTTYTIEDIRDGNVIYTEQKWTTCEVEQETRINNEFYTLVYPTPWVIFYASLH